VYYQGHCPACCDCLLRLPASALHAGRRAAKSAALEAPVLRMRNIACVVSDMTNSEELPMPGITAKKTLELKAPHRTKLAPDHP